MHLQVLCNFTILYSMYIPMNYRNNWLHFVQLCRVIYENMNTYTKLCPSVSPYRTVCWWKELVEVSERGRGSNMQVMFDFTTRENKDKL